MLRKKKSLGFLSRIILCLNVLATICLILAYFAPITNPHVFWPVAFFGIAYPLLLGINLLFVLYWFFRKPLYALLPLIAIGIGWPAIKKNFGMNSPSEEKGKNAHSIRLLTYNVHLFRSFEENRKLDTKRAILDIFKETEPDILCLQEFYTRKQGKNDLRTHLKRHFGFRHYYFSPVAQNEYDAYGTAIFSKFPIVNSGYLRSSDQKDKYARILFADIKKDSQTIRVYNVHLQSIGFKEEDYEFIRKANTNMDEDISSTKRIGGRLKRAYLKRATEANALAQHIDSCKMPYLVAGDFNDTPLSYAVNRISKNMKNAFVEKGRGWAVTYNGDFPNFQIDYILASKDFHVRNYRIISQKLSDHFPVWSDLELRAERDTSKN